MNNLQPKAEWQPIDTAPRDGTRVHLKAMFGQHEFETEGSWVPGMDLWTHGGMSRFPAHAWRSM